MEPPLTARLNRAIEDLKAHVAHVPPGMLPVSDVSFRSVILPEIGPLGNRFAQVRFVEFLEELAAVLDRHARSVNVVAPQIPGQQKFDFDS